MSGIETGPAGAVLCFGEMLLRLAAPQGQMLLQSPAFEASWGGAEMNVAVSLARLGQRAAAVTVLPENALGAAARAALMGQGVDVSPIRRAPGRMGLYYLTPGAGLRAAEVIYDRAHSAFAEADLAAWDWPRLLAGAGRLHVSGVTPAIGPNGAAGALAAVRAATASGVPVSFDGNFRSKLWAAWAGDPVPVLAELFEHADIVFADDRDLALVLGTRFEAAEPVQRRLDAAAAGFAGFPQLQRIASMLRVPVSSDCNELSAVMVTRDTGACRTATRRLTSIVDRVGTGDAFAAGLLFALGRGQEDQAALDFALAAACVKHTILGDFNLATEPDILAALSEGYDIRR